MIELSKEFAVLPFLLVQEWEIKNFISRRLGLTEVDLKELLINQNTENLLAGTPKIVSKQTGKEIERVNREIEKLIATTEFKKYILSTPARRNSSLEQKFVDEAEEARNMLRTLNNDRERKIHLINGDYIRLMRKIMEVYKVTDEYKGKIPDLERLGNILMIRKSLPLPIHTVKDQVSFMREFPLFYTHRTLISFRDRNLDRPIQSNDLIDIMGYITPIVYFHYIVGEKYFITLAKQAKLGKLYNTALCYKLVELKPYLEKLARD